MTPFVAEHNPVYAQTGSAVTTLTSLTVADQSADDNPVSMLMPAFESDAAPAAGGYVVYASSAVIEVTVTAQTTHSQATVTVDGSASDNGAVNVMLSGNDTKIEVEVTAGNNFDTDTYTINVKKVANAAETTLSSLSVMAGGDDLTLAPAFATTDAAAAGNPGHSEMPYAADVSAATSSVMVKAVATHTGATVKTSSGTQMGDGVNDRFTLKAAGMDTEIMVEVTAQDKATSTTYHIKISRASSTASKDTNLSDLKLTLTDLSGETDVDAPVVTAAPALTLSPVFMANRGPAAGGYSTSVAAGVPTIYVVAASSSRGATIAVMAEGTAASDIDSDEAISVVTLADSGDTTIKVIVTAADGATKATYTITVTQTPDIGDATVTLASLSVKAGSRELITDFVADSDTPSTFSRNVLNTRSSVVVNAVPSHRGASVQVTSSPGSVRGPGTGPYTVTLGSSGVTTITVTVTPADGPSAGVYTIIITRAAVGAAVTTLNSLTVAGQAADDNFVSMLMPAFESDAAPAAGGYVVYASSAVIEVTVTAQTTHSQATVTVDGSASDNGAVNVMLSGNDTKIEVEVTAENTVDTAAYTINVMRASDTVSDLDTLASLSVMAGGDDLTSLAPAFATTDAAAAGNPGHSEMPYAADVSAATSSVMVKAVATHTGATVKTSSGTQMGDGVNDRFTLKAAGMDTEIMVEVTAQDKATSTTYHIKISRASSTASKDTNLSDLKLTLTDLSGETDVDAPVVTAAPALTLSPVFMANRGPAAGGYSTSVAAGVPTIYVVAASSSRGATIAVMAEGTAASDIDSDEAISVVTLADSGDTTIKVIVTAADGATKATYTITVAKEVANANDMLSSLELGIDLMPPFSPSIRSYRAIAPSDVASLDVMATSAHPKADVIIRKVVGEVDGAENMDTDDMKIEEGIGSVSAMVPIGVGLNTITIEADPVLQMALSEPYIIVIRRAESDNATLSALSLGDDIGMSPTFAGTRTRYTAKVPTGTTQVTVMATASHDNAEVDIMPADNDTDMEGHQVAISGDRTANITVEVTAEDGETMMTYMVEVSIVSTDATLSSLSLMTKPMEGMGEAIDLKDMDGMMAAFMADTMMYYADVDAGVEMINVMATAMDSDATVSGDGAVSLDVGENTITVTVTAEDGTSQETYTVTVTVVARTLLDRYDNNPDNGHIDRAEAVRAVLDYQSGDLTRAEAVQVILLYQAGPQ